MHDRSPNLFRVSCADPIARRRLLGRLLTPVLVVHAALAAHAALGVRAVAQPPSQSSASLVPPNAQSN
jgi:hypothetical protein